MSDNKTPFNKELIGLLLLFSFLVLWTIRSHAQPVTGNKYKSADLKMEQYIVKHDTKTSALF